MGAREVEEVSVKKACRLVEAEEEEEELEHLVKLDLEEVLEGLEEGATKRKRKCFQKKGRGALKKRRRSESEEKKSESDKLACACVREGLLIS